jgi:chromosome segregation ATPase
MGTHGSSFFRGHAAAWVLLAVTGCDSGAKEQAKIADIQHQADQKITEAQSAASAKVAEAEKRIDELQKQLADAGTHVRAEMQEELDRAKAEADKLAAEAAAALARARSAYKESANRQFYEILKDTDELHLKAAKLPAKAKAPIDKSVKDIAAKKTDLKKDIDAFDTATLDTLRTTKAKVDQKLHELRQMVHAARARLPS